MTSFGIGLRSRQVPPREDADLLQGAAVEEREKAEELGHREASVPPAYFEFEDAVLFADLEGMDNMLSAGGQLKFTGDPGGPTVYALAAVLGCNRSRSQIETCNGGFNRQ
jgi:hypothetical protein